jgi:hypothetical protein
MPAQIDFLFAQGAGYEDLVERIQSNPRFVFYVKKADRIDKRTRRAKVKGWAKIEHKRYEGAIWLDKSHGRCSAEIEGDETGEFTGSWVSWIIRNAPDLIYGLDLRFAE